MKVEAVMVTAAIIVRDGKVLIARRPDGGRHPGRWEFPGGKIEPGESAEECLARELQEEMGVDVEVGERLASVRHAYREMTVELVAYGCRLVGGEPRDIGCSSHAWVVPGGLSAFDLLPPDRALAAMIFSGERGGGRSRFQA